MKFAYLIGHLVLPLLMEKSLAINDLVDWKSIFISDIVGEIFTSGGQTYALVTSLRDFVRSQELCLSNGAKLVDFASRDIQSHLYTEKLQPLLNTYCVWVDIREYLDNNLEFIESPGITPLEFVDSGIENLYTDGFFECVAMCVRIGRPNAFWSKFKCFKKLPSLCELVRETTLMTTPELITPKPKRLLQTKTQSSVLMVRELWHFKFTRAPDWKRQVHTLTWCARICREQNCARFTYCMSSKVCEVYLTNPPDKLKPSACDIWKPTIIKM